MNNCTLTSESVLYAENSQNQRILKIRDYKQFFLVMSRSGPVTGIKVFTSAGTSVIEVQVPSQQEIPSLGRVNHEELENYARQFIPTETDHPKF